MHRWSVRLGERGPRLPGGGGGGAGARGGAPSLPGPAPRRRAAGRPPPRSSQALQYAKDQAASEAVFTGLISHHLFLNTRKIECSEI